MTEERRNTGGEQRENKERENKEEQNESTAEGWEK